MAESEIEEEVTGMCRLCAGACVMRFTKDAGGRIVKARGERDHPVTHGYACSKGLTLHEAHYSPDRLLHSLKRLPDGRFVPVPLAEAFDEITERIARLVDRHGPDALGVYRGTYGYDNVLMQSFMQALGSRSFFSTITIDQSAKFITADRMGTWEAGKDPFHSADVILLSGVNPLVSHTTFNFPLQNPLRQLRIARERGLKLIVIDPRRTETAKQADVFLQVRPGEDAVLFAGLVREVLARGWTDPAFCAAHVEGVAELARAVEPFTLARVAARTGASEADLEEVVRAFAEPLPTRLKRGSALSGTGTDMGPHSNLAEHLLECLNVLCGRYARAGDKLSNPGVFAVPRPWRAQVVPPGRSWEQGWKSSATGYGMLAGEKMTGALADEILTPGPDQVRALICDAGNPVNAVPGQERMVEALRSLELLVTIDPFMTNTARLSDFVLAPRMMLERMQVGNRMFEPMFLTWPMSTYAPPIIDPPKGAELVESWETPFELARRLGLTLQLDGMDMAMDERPSDLAINRRLYRDSTVPFEEIMRHPSGHMFSPADMFVTEGDPANAARFQVAPGDVVAELAALSREAAAESGYSHRLAVRRTREVFNTMLQFPSARRRRGHNPAFLHPDDLAAMGLEEGAKVRLSSAHGSVGAWVAADPDLRPGVVSLSHGWGGLPGDAEFGEAGTSSNRLTSDVAGRDPINAMPVMTGVPVNVVRFGGD